MGDAYRRRRALGSCRLLRPRVWAGPPLAITNAGEVGQGAAAVRLSAAQRVPVCANELYLLENVARGRSSYLCCGQV
jgi:hypothetical protein